MSRVLIVEDDLTMGEMLAYNLRRQGFEIELVVDGTQGLKAARSQEVALVVLDLMLPGVDGMEITRQVRRNRPDLPILMLTAKGEESVKLKGFASGIDDFLAKPFSMEELIARVKALLRRSRVAALRSGEPEDVVLGDLRLSPRDLRCWVGDAEVSLRPREFTLLATLASEPGRLLTRQDLADKVWGYEAMADTRTIDTHIKNLRRKVESASAFRYIETVRGVGYRFRVQPRADS